MLVQVVEVVVGFMVSHMWTLLAFSSRPRNSTHMHVLYIKLWHMAHFVADIVEVGEFHCVGRDDETRFRLT